MQHLLIDYLGGGSGRHNFYPLIYFNTYLLFNLDFTREIFMNSKTMLTLSLCLFTSISYCPTALHLGLQGPSFKTIIEVTAGAIAGWKAAQTPRGFWTEGCTMLGTGAAFVGSGYMMEPGKNSSCGRELADPNAVKDSVLSFLTKKKWPKSQEYQNVHKKWNPVRMASLGFGIAWTVTKAFHHLRRSAPSK